MFVRANREDDIVFRFFFYLGLVYPPPVWALEKRRAAFNLVFRSPLIYRVRHTKRTVGTIYRYVFGVLSQLNIMALDRGKSSVHTFGIRDRISKHTRLRLPTTCSVFSRRISQHIVPHRFPDITNPRPISRPYSRPISRRFSRPISLLCSRPISGPVPRSRPVLSHEEIVHSHPVPLTKWLPTFPSHSHPAVNTWEPFPMPSLGNTPKKNRLRRPRRSLPLPRVPLEIFYPWFPICWRLCLIPTKSKKRFNRFSVVLNNASYPVFGFSKMLSGAHL